MNTEKRYKLNPTLARSSPILYFYALLLYCIIQPSYSSLYLFITFNIIVISNILLKYISKSIYSLFNIETIPLLGIGKRPENATSCGTYLDGLLSTTYGMPSGHSQIAWSVAIYFILKIIKNWYNNDKENKPITIIGYIWIILSCIIILGIATYISYSRVYIEGCHTIQQVIIGGILGCVMGFLVFFFETPVINLLSSIY
jgi:membrane-associated phospholipid phosphatase